MVPLCLVGLEGGARPRSYRGKEEGGEGAPHISSAPAQVQQRDGVILAPTGAPVLASLRTP